MLPRGTVLMIATDQIDYWFNIYGQGLGEYLGKKFSLLSLSLITMWIILDTFFYSMCHVGWYLCDGRNGTPDLTGRVPIGRDLFNSQSEYHKIGMTGGTESFRLTENQIPRHSHNINLKTDSTGQHSHAYTDTLFPQACQPWPDYGLWFTEEVYPAPQRRKANYINRENWSADSGSHSHELKGRTETSGDSMPVDIRQPYYVVSYIIFLGTVGGNVNDILVG